MAESQAEQGGTDTTGAAGGAGDPAGAGGTAGARGERAPRTRARTGRTAAPRGATELLVQAMPELRNPVLVMAFEGWNDAGEAASTAAQVVKSQRSGDRFASIDPEEFFVFTDTRPHVRTTRRGRRRIHWPANEFFACPDPSDDPEAHDLIVLLGTEPDLRWRAFGDLVLDVAKRTGVQLVVA
ncbi:MAG: PAC2 family protein, partial [Chloroflexota bacterium]